jgi:hypothetical protein
VDRSCSAKKWPAGRISQQKQQDFETSKDSAFQRPPRLPHSNGQNAGTPADAIEIHLDRLLFAFEFPKQWKFGNSYPITIWKNETRKTQSRTNLSHSIHPSIACAERLS